MTLMNSPLLFVTMIGTMALTGAALLKAWPELLATGAPRAGDYVSIAGLRGLLASSVFVHHAQVGRVFFREGAWLYPESSLYVFAGTGSVGVFFMITGFLFWGKVLDGRIAFWSLVKSRARRILPLYTLSCLLIFLVCAYQSHFSLAVGWSDLCLSIAQWLGGGLLGRPAINGVGTLTINCGVTWTLQYEWIFYLVLPFIAAWSSPRRFCFLSGIFLIVLLGSRMLGFREQYDDLVTGFPFFGGMLAAYAVRHRSGRPVSRSFLTSGFVAASFVIGALAYTPGRFTLVALGLFPAFAAIALGDDVFGLLRLRCVRFLGEISFSVYLLHGIILMSTLRAIDRLTDVGRMPYYAYVLVCTALCAMVILASTATFLWVERRFMKRGVSATAGRTEVPA